MKLEELRTLVDTQYTQKHPNRDGWSDWLYTDHVLWVADKTKELCKRYDGNADIAVAAALLHDVADSVMPRSNKTHQQTSMDIGNDLCSKAGYSPSEIAIIMDDIILKHSCRDGIIPESHEGKIMTSADACAHFQTSFYLYAFGHGSSLGDYEWLLNWMSNKLDKDFHKKIFFNEVREEIRPHYETLKQIATS